MVLRAANFFNTCLLELPSNFHLRLTLSFGTLSRAARIVINASGTAESSIAAFSSFCDSSDVRLLAGELSSSPADSAPQLVPHESLTRWRRSRVPGEWAHGSRGQRRQRSECTREGILGVLALIWHFPQKQEQRIAATRIM